MPAVQEWCEVRTNNGIFRNWTAVSVHYGVDPSFERIVQLELAEVMAPGTIGSGSVATTAQRLLPGGKIDVALGGQLVIQGGEIKIRQASFDSERHAVQIVAVSKANPIREVSVDLEDGGQYRGYTFSAIANKVLAPVGVNLQLVNAPEIANLPFPNVIVQTGETIGELIERLARQRGLWLWTAPDGTIMAGNPASDSAATLIEGVNIVSANSYLEFPQAEMVAMYSQSHGSDDLWGRRASEVGALARIPGGGSGRKIIGLAEHPNTQAELQVRTDHEVTNILAMTHRDLITHKGWFRPGTSKLWHEGDTAVVKSPMLYPFNNNQMTMRVWGVTCSQSNEGGTTTQVELVNEATFTHKYPDANIADPFNPTATAAVPEPAA